jgi:hypothetical protein
MCDLTGSIFRPQDRIVVIIDFSVASHWHLLPRRVNRHHPFSVFWAKRAARADLEQIKPAAGRIVFTTAHTLARGDRGPASELSVSCQHVAMLAC